MHWGQGYNPFRGTSLIVGSRTPVFCLTGSWPVSPALVSWGWNRGWGSLQKKQQSGVGEGGGLGSELLESSLLTPPSFSLPPGAVGAEGEAHPGGMGEGKVRGGAKGSDFLGALEHLTLCKAISSTPLVLFRSLVALEVGTIASIFKTVRGREVTCPTAHSQRVSALGFKVRSEPKGGLF